MWIKRLALALTLVASAVQADPKFKSFHDILAMPHAEAAQRIAYGPDPRQFGELWLPRGKGPHRLVVMIHGGCWRADLPGLELQAPLSAALAARGWAVWNLEYRRIGHPAGGWPGTFQDVAQGVDAVRNFSAAKRIDLSRVVFVGHSAGGHLATWAAARHGILKTSPLWAKDPLNPKAVISLAGIIDLQAYRATGPDACGGPTVIEDLVGWKARGDAAFADTSPPLMAPSGVRQVVVSGGLDPIVPARFGQAFTVRAAASGDPVTHRLFPDAGHFELIDPTSPAWNHLFVELEALVPAHD